MKYKYLLVCILTSSFFVNGYAQLDTIHWFPPLHSMANSQIEDHYVYLSTPSTVPIVVTIKDGSGKVLATPSVSNAAPFKYSIGTGQKPATKIAVPIDSLSKVLKASGLICTAITPFYANLRLRSASQAESITGKGTAAKGTDFRIASFPQQEDWSTRNFVAGIMATENSTTVTISDYDPAIVFSAKPADLTDDVITVVLNKGESYVVSGYLGATYPPANRAGFVGAHLVATAPVVLSNGNMLGSISPGNGQDLALDQSVPIDQLGKKYVVIRGDGKDNMERPLVIAAYDNTVVSTGKSGVVTTLVNAGDWVLLNESEYTGTVHQSMYINTSQPAYLYQPLGGAPSEATPGMNFIAPLSCLMPNSVDNIYSADTIGVTAYNADLTVVTGVGATLKVNGVVQAGAQSITGLSDWETYRIANVKGNLKVESTSPLALSVFGYNGNAGFASYFSGFGSKPIVSSVSASSSLDCDQGFILKTAEFNTYQWHFNSQPIVEADSIAYHATSSGSYFVVVTKSGCADTSNALTINTSPLTAIANLIGNVPCGATLGGSASATATGGNGAYTYSWMPNGASSSLITGLSVGVYTVTATDANGCLSTSSVSIIQDSDIIITINNTTSVTCNGGNNGLITVSASGSVAPYTYNWSSGQTVTTLSNLSAGTYVLTVTDGIGCTKAKSIQILQPSPLILTLSAMERITSTSTSIN